MPVGFVHLASFDLNLLLGLDGFRLLGKPHGEYAILEVCFDLVGVDAAHLVLSAGHRSFPEANAERDHQTATIDNEAGRGDHGKARETSPSEMDSDPTTAGNHERAACNG